MSNDPLYLQCIYNLLNCFLLVKYIGIIYNGITPSPAKAIEYNIIVIYYYDIVKNYLEEIIFFDFNSLRYFLIFICL